MDDIRAIMDAIGSERAAVMGESEGGPLAMLFAAAHPERTVALVLQGAEVRERTDDEWPWGEATAEEHEVSMASISERFSLGLGIYNIAPSIAGQEWARVWRAKVVTHAATPNSAEAFMRMAFDIDVRHIVPAINVPTLIVHAAGDRVCHVENARYLARHIPGSRYVEISTEDHVPWFEPNETVAEIREFLTGRRETGTPDRILATVLFTDLVGSTERAAELGRPALARPARTAPRCRATRASAVRRPGGGHGGRRLLRDVRRSGKGHSLRAGDHPCGPPFGSRSPGRTAHRRGLSSQTARSPASL